MRTPNSHSLIGPNSTVLIDQNGATLVGNDANEDVAAQLQMGGESLSFIGRFNPRSSLIRVDSDSRSTVQEAWQSSL